MIIYIVPQAKDQNLSSAETLLKPVGTHKKNFKKMNEWFNSQVLHIFCKEIFLKDTCWIRG